VLTVAVAVVYPVLWRGERRPVFHVIPTHCPSKKPDTGSRDERMAADEQREVKLTRRGWRGRGKGGEEGRGGGGVIL
jgi:hypothetical protein